MNKQDYIKRIVELCQGDNGFLVLLHSHNTFDKNKYQELLGSLYDYQKILGAEPDIDRNVAGCLFAFAEALDSAVRRIDQTDPSQKEILSDAYAEVWDLIQELFMH